MSSTLPVTFWDVSTIGTSLPAWSTAVPFNNFAYVGDGLTSGGSIGFGYKYGTPYQTGGSQCTEPPANWQWASGPSQGKASSDIIAPTFGTYQQTAFTLAQGTSTETLALEQACQDSDESGCTLKYTVGFDFTQYDATDQGAPTAGATFAGTQIGLATFFAGVEDAKTTFQLRATTLDGSPADFSGWKLFMADGTCASGSVRVWTLSSTGFIEGTAQLAPNGNCGASRNTAFGIMQLPQNQRYVCVACCI
jgi:hypothetical protein